jgi:uncharacterized membrane protein YbaN (DUF454 family)
MIPAKGVRHAGNANNIHGDKLIRGEAMAGTVKKAALIISGLACLALGVTGLLLPVVPATPFLLLAAWCFARSSGRLYEKLKSNRLIGRFIREFTGRKIFRKKAMKSAVAFLWLSVIIAFFLVKNPWLRLLILAIGLAFSLLMNRIRRI